MFDDEDFDADAICPKCGKAYYFEIGLFGDKCPYCNPVPEPEEDEEDQT
jgi:hypothetical protein